MVQPKKHLIDIHRSALEKYDRTRYLRLDKNENTSNIPAFLLKKGKAGITPELISTYPQVYLLYEKLSRYLSLDENCILITAGSDAAIKNVFEVFINPQDEVIIPDPTYAMYEIYARLYQATLHKVPYGLDLSFSMETLRLSVTEKTKLIALANPNSPTGCVFSPKELVDLIKFTEQRNILLLIDEAYYPYYPYSLIQYVKSYTNLIVTRTFSKAFGLASLRLGYAAAHPELIRSLSKFRPNYETNGLAVLFGCLLLDNPDVVEKNVRDAIEGREFLADEMSKMGFFSYPSQTNFLNIKVGKRLVIPLTEYLNKKGILIKPGFDHPALRECIRITVGPVHQMNLLTEHIHAFISTLPH